MRSATAEGRAVDAPHGYQQERHKVVHFLHTGTRVDTPVMVKHASSLVDHDISTDWRDAAECVRQTSTVNFFP